MENSNVFLIILIFVVLYLMNTSQNSHVMTGYNCVNKACVPAYNQNPQYINHDFCIHDCGATHTKHACNKENAGKFVSEQDMINQCFEQKENNCTSDQNRLIIDQSADITLRDCIRADKCQGVSFNSDGSFTSYTKITSNSKLDNSCYIRTKFD